MLTIAAAMPDNGRLTVVLRGINLEGDELTKTVAVALPALEPGAAASGVDASEVASPAVGRQRLADAGLTLMSLGDQTQIGGVRFGSRAQRSGWEQGWDVLEVKAPNPQRWSDHWVYLPALLLLAGMWVRQGRRDGGSPEPLHRAIGVVAHPPRGQGQLRGEDGHGDAGCRQGRHRREQAQAPAREQKGANDGLHQIVRQRHPAGRRQPCAHGPENPCPQGPQKGGGVGPA
ncbi:hypothetical protein G6F31_017115 [Rhizopus arrhizus]|nr:hypothetical protein G6F31_017115 [Rhizopus arrhizus]